ncbi:20604_t:CDS:2 [Rhizophagus irregularis]|nr:20604_t:CDS:2 [Rhizophagus irregularis]
MNSRNAKKRANDKITTDNINKRGRKKQEMVVPSLENLNDLLNDANSQQSKSKGAKRGRKKKQEMVAPPASQIISELLPIITLLTRTNSQNQKDDALSNSRANNSFDYISSNESTPALESRNEFVPLIRTSRTVSPVLESRNEFVLSHRTRSAVDLRNDISNEYIHLNRNSSSVSDSRENRINIINNTRNMMNTSRHHFDTTTKVVPSPFDEMTIYQLCSWLCANPDILQLANNMHSSMQTPVVKGLRLMTSTTPGSLTMPQHQENKMQSCRDFLEELKCLFLRVRNPQKRVLEELIRKVIKCELNSAEGIEWLHTANRHFGDFRNKLVNDESVAEHVLSWWINATNLDELRAKNSMYYLCKFIRHTFAINYSLKDTEGTKALDKITKDIAVPSRNGQNFASNLKL